MIDKRRAAAALMTLGAWACVKAALMIGAPLACVASAVTAWALCEEHS